MHLTITCPNDLAAVPDEQRAAATASYELWVANKEMHANLKNGAAGEFLAPMMERDALPETFVWDTSKGAMA